MQFNSFAFLLFFPVVLLVYFLVPRKGRYLWLLLASYVFYMGWSVRYASLLALSTVLTYAGSLVLTAMKDRPRAQRRLVLFAVLTANLGILAYYKYANFLLGTFFRLLQVFSPAANPPVLDIVLPVGISFFIFQALGYMIDVYRGNLEPERNLFRYALFVSFFPQLVAGPIERASNLMPQLRRVDSLELWDFKRIQAGCVHMLYGFLMKMIIADRAAIAVNEVFADPALWPPLAYAIAILLFTIQIYCDFGGYSAIAIGCAQVMGIRLMDNFRAPYLARSIRDFWGRWHISLSTWFMDYVYIPLGGNRKGRWKKYRNLLTVFAVSGLWHGAAWHFVFWGLCHAVFRIFGEISLPWRRRFWKKLGVSESSRFLAVLSTLGTFLLVAVAWLFFRAQSLSQALLMLRALPEAVRGPWTLSSLMSDGFLLGLRPPEMVLLLVSIFLLFISDFLAVRGKRFLPWFERQRLPLRIAFFLLGTVLLLVFGIYGNAYDASSFIYFQF